MIWFGIPRAELMAAFTLDTIEACMFLALIEDEVAPSLEILGYWQPDDTKHEARIQGLLDTLRRQAGGEAILIAADAVGTA